MRTKEVGRARRDAGVVRRCAVNPEGKLGDAANVPARFSGTERGAIAAAPLLPGCSAPLAPVPPVTRFQGTSRVAAIRGQNLRRTTREALEALRSPGPRTAGGNRLHQSQFHQCRIGKFQYHRKLALAPNRRSSWRWRRPVEVGAAHVVIVRSIFNDFFLAQDSHTDRVGTMADEARWLNQRCGPRVVLACSTGDSPDWDFVPSPWTSRGDCRVQPGDPGRPHHLHPRAEKPHRVRHDRRPQELRRRRLAPGLRRGNPRTPAPPHRRWRHRAVFP